MRERRNWANARFLPPSLFFRQWFWGVAPARLSEIALATAPKRASAKLQIFTLVQVWKWSAQAKSFTEKDLPGYIITHKFPFVKKNFQKSYPQEINRISTGCSIDLLEKIIIIHIMKNENKRPTKKALVKQLEERGVDKAIVVSLQRANIDTLVWVLSKIS